MTRVQGRETQVDSDHTMMPTINMACKQGIDRGVIMNLMVRMLVDAKAKGRFELSRTQIHQYIGYAMGRATSVEAREIQDKRFEALSNFVLMVSQSSPEQMQLFLDALDFPPDMRFIPSNSPAASPVPLGTAGVEPARRPAYEDDEKRE